jgi:hypothetical protein
MVDVIENMPADEYHAIDALSSSGIKEILVSVTDYMANEKKETEAKTLGQAYHAAILEGVDVFNERFCTPFDGSDTLKTKEDMINFCNNNGIVYKASWNKDVIKDAINTNSDGAVFFDDAYMEHTKGRTMISEDNYNRIVAYSKIIEDEGVINNLHSTELSVFWTDANGIPCKARFDGISHQGVFDLKTFNNISRKPINKVVTNAIINYRYDIQAAFYIEAYNACKAAGIKHFTAKDPLFYMLFLQTEAGLNLYGQALGYYCDADYWLKAQEDIETAKSLYLKYIVNKEPVQHKVNFEALADMNLPLYFLTRR